MSKEPTIATLAETFGQCVAACPPPLSHQEDDRLKRLRRIARILDRLTRAPARRSGATRARRIYEELAAIAHSPARMTPASLWATN